MFAAKRHPSGSSSSRPVAFVSKTIVVACALACAIAAAAAAPAMAVPSLPASGAPYVNGPSNRYTLNGDWSFLHDPANTGLRDRFYKKKSFADWQTISVPNAWNTQDPTQQSHAGSIGWYATQFVKPASAGGSSWILRFESVNYFARVWLNGREIGRHSGAYVPFEIDARSIHAGINTLVVRVDSRLSPKTVPPADEDADQPSGGWWNYSGILREVILRRATGLDLTNATIDTYALRRGCTRCGVRVRLRAQVRNMTGRKMRVRVSALFGGQSVRFKKFKLGRHGVTQVSAQIKIRKPKLWNPLKPTLYPVSMAAAGGRGASAGYRFNAGLRTFRVNGAGTLLMNDRAVQLRGVSLHESDPNVGAAWTPSVRAQNLGLVENMGANLLRSHYALHPATFEWADSHGVLMWVQAPVYRVRDNALRRSAYIKASTAAIRDMIVANRQHPSVLTWSLGNELIASGTVAVLRLVSAGNAQARRLDPTGLTALDVAAAPRTVLQQPGYRRVDVIGINQYFGWYPGADGSTRDRSALVPYLDSFHATYGRQAMFVTEFGAEANRLGPADEPGTFDFQANFFIDHMRMISSRKYINGMVAWLLRDYWVRPEWAGGNVEPGPPYGYKGLTDQNGVPKPAYEEVAQSWRATYPFKK